MVHFRHLVGTRLLAGSLEETCQVVGYHGHPGVLAVVQYAFLAPAWEAAVHSVGSILRVHLAPDPAEVVVKSELAAENLVIARHRFDAVAEDLCGINRLQKILAVTLVAVLDALLAIVAEALSCVVRSSSTEAQAQHSASNSSRTQCYYLQVVSPVL